MAETSQNTSRGWIIGIGTFVVLLALIFGIRSFFHDTVEVRTATASFENLTSTISTTGKVEPVNDYQAHATSPGVVQKVFVEIGQRVSDGQELMRMDDSDARSRVAAAQASLDAAQANLDNMKQGGTLDERRTLSSDLSNAQTQQKSLTARLATTQALQAKGAASANEVASIQQQLADANARVSQLQTRSSGRYTHGDLGAQQAQVAQARAALAAARASYNTVDIRAPFAGTVYSIPVSDHDFIQGGEALLNMADLNRIQVRAYFDEPEIGKLQDGQAVSIVWDAKPYNTWHGHVVRAPTTIITYGTRNVGECMISIDDSKGDLLPNTNVTAKVVVSQLNNVLSLPREALRTEGPKNFVYRIVNDKLVKTAVQVGASNQTRIQILNGINKGDTVALNSPNNIEFRDGLEVKPIP